jgi:hypothetical protein
MHVSPQQVNPRGHPVFTQLTGLPLHTPAKHFCPCAQTTPHPPQWFGSFFSSTQVFPQFVSPPPQTRPLQMPPEHAWPGAHARPHAPQFPRSASSFTQTRPQHDNPPEHVAPAPQRPTHVKFWQASPTGHCEALVHWTQVPLDESQIGVAGVAAQSASL